MPTLIELADLEANVDLCQRLRLAFVELNMDCPAYSPQSLPADRLRRLGETVGIAFTLHLPEKIDLAAFNPHIRAGHLACCKEALAWAADAGVRLVNLHLSSGVYFTLPGKRVWLYEVHRPDFLQRLEQSFHELLALAKARGVTVCIENTGNFSQGFIGEAVKRLIALDPNTLQLTWDVGHDAGAGYADRPIFEQFRSRIGHVHLHDWDGKQSHSVLFSGQVDVPGILALARQLGVAAVIETKTVESLKESLRQLDERGLR